jgi:hypothetical protein
MKVGDRVKMKKSFSHFTMGEFGTVIHILPYDDIGVEWDKAFDGGHDCREHGKQGHCFYIDRKYIEVIPRLSWRERLQE